MPMPKGTKPRHVNFAEVGENDLRIILRKTAAEGVLHSNTHGHRTIWTLDGAIIAKKHVYQRSEQILVKPHLLEKLPKIERPEAKDLPATGAAI